MWQPSVLMAPNNDTRKLGAYVYGIEMISQAGAPLEDLN